jgi:xanthine dehydrogenase small subunit
MHGMVEAGIDLDDQSLRYGLSGNLCRCTGYAQILDAGKSVEAASVSRISQLYPDKPILDAFAELGEEPVQVEGEQTVFVPRTVQQAVEFKSLFPAATIVSGATDYGVLHNHGRTAPADLLCLTSVEDYDAIVSEDDVLRIGGGATWTQIESHVEKLFPPYHVIVTRFGSPQIRNAGTLAGNLASGSPIADSIPFHLVMDSQLRLVSSRGQREVALNEFYTGYRETIMADDELIAEVITPLLAQDERLAIYKISKRRDMDISTLTLGLWIKLQQETITDARLAIGGVGPTVLRIPACEEHLVGKTFNESTMQAAGAIAKEQISPWTDVRGGADFRRQLAENLLLKAYHEFAGESLTHAS